MVLKVVAVPGGGRTVIVPVKEHPFLPNHHFFPPANTASMRRVSHVAKREGVGVSCTTANKANLRNKQGGETFASNLCTEVQRVGRGKGGSYRSTAAGSAYPLGYEFAPREWSAAAERGSQRR